MEVDFLKLTQKKKKTLDVLIEEKEVILICIFYDIHVYIFICLVCAADNFSIFYICKKQDNAYIVLATVKHVVNDEDGWYTACLYLQ